jgi:hypothetical protein
MSRVIKARPAVIIPTVPRDEKRNKKSTKAAVWAFIKTERPQESPSLHWGLQFETMYRIKNAVEYAKSCNATKPMIQTIMTEIAETDEDIQQLADKTKKLRRDALMATQDDQFVRDVLDGIESSPQSEAAEDEAEEEAVPAAVVESKAAARAPKVPVAPKAATARAPVVVVESKAAAPKAAARAPVVVVESKAAAPEVVEVDDEDAMDEDFGALIADFNVPAPPERADNLEFHGVYGRAPSPGEEFLKRRIYSLEAKLNEVVNYLRNCPLPFNHCLVPMPS